MPLTETLVNNVIRFVAVSFSLICLFSIGRSLLHHKQAWRYAIGNWASSVVRLSGMIVLLLVTTQLIRTSK